MDKKHIQIEITGDQGAGKTTAFAITVEALRQAGLTIIPLNPIPELGMEDRVMACTDDTIINIFTKQKEVSNV